jgi:hypothetical protein
MARQPADPFGFLAAIQTDHLTPEQVDQVNQIFEQAEERRNA